MPSPTALLQGSSWRLGPELFKFKGNPERNKGAPALVLKGEISGLIDQGKIVSSDDIYPYLTNNLIKKTGLNNHQIKCLLWKLKIKGDKRYHNSIKTGKNSEVHKYNKTVLEMLNRYKAKEGYLETSCREFNEAHPSKGRIKKKNH